MSDCWATSSASARGYMVRLARRHPNGERLWDAVRRADGPRRDRLDDLSVGADTLWACGDEIDAVLDAAVCVPGRDAASGP